MCKRADDWQRASAGNAVVLLRCLVNTLRLARGPMEGARVVGLFVQSLIWNLTGRPGIGPDRTIRLNGVTHVLGLATGELLVPQEIYWERGYDRLPGFVPRPGWTVLDIGANTGIYAVQQARRGACVYAFEPNPHCYRRLCKAVKANGVGSRVTAINCAMGSTSGTAELLLPGGLTTMGSLRPIWNADLGRNAVNVAVDTVDAFVGSRDIARIDLLKIDVEGFEIDVLQGASETLRVVDRVVIEYHSQELGRRAVELLADAGFESLRASRQSPWAGKDDRLYQGDEAMRGGDGLGLVYAARHAGLANVQPPAAPAVAGTG